MLRALGSVVLGWFRDQGASWTQWLRWLQTDRQWRHDEADVAARLRAALNAAGLPEVAQGQEPEDVLRLRVESSELPKRRRLAETDYLCLEATRLGVAVPEDRVDPTPIQPGRMIPVCEHGLVDGRRALNGLGIRELRESLAARRRRRREPWIATTSAVVGIIGALTGLLALTFAHVGHGERPRGAATVPVTTTTTGLGSGTSTTAPTTVPPRRRHR